MNPETAVTPGAPPRLSVHDVTVRFGGLVALDSVSFDIPASQVVGVIGPNGAGKTTLFNVVCGFTRPQTGQLRLDGQAFRPSPHRLTHHGISRSLQGLGLFPSLTVLENIMAGASNSARAGFFSGLLALPRSDRDEADLSARALAIIDELSLGDVAHALPSTLPYAIGKRVALGRALISDPRLLLLDEPAGGLGHADIDELVALIASMPTRNGCSVMLVEHHVDMVMKVSDHVVVLDFGKVIARGTPAEVRDDPAVAAAYLGTEVTA